MKQIVLQEPGHFISKDAPRATASPHEALVQVRSVGVCGSDFHAFSGRHPEYSYPRIIGHELSGIVVEIPRNDRGIRVGDQCAIEPYVSCGACRACLHGRTNCCERLRVLGIHTDGGMQGFLSVPVSLLHKSTILSLDQLALVETLGIGAHAVVRSGVKPGEDVLVIGAGPIGLAVSQFAEAAGAKVRVVEKSEWRRDFAERMGFATCADVANELADVVFDATGSAASMGASLYHGAPGARVVYVGLTRDSISIEDPLFHRRELTLYASRNSRDQFPRIIKMIEDSKIDTSLWITDRMELSEVPARFAELPGKPTLIKAVVDVNDASA